jgi:hypothetical protein
MARVRFVGIMARVRFLHLRTPILLGVHISDDRLRSLVDMNMLYPDVLVTPVT